FCARSSSFVWPPGRSSALLNGNSTSVESVIFSITTGAGAAAASGAGAGSGALAIGAGGIEARGTASHGAAALSGVHSAPERQHRPNGFVATTPAPEPTYPVEGGGLVERAVAPAAWGAVLRCAVAACSLAPLV